MKKTYETPVAEKIEFCYEDQIVASGATQVNMIDGCPMANLHIALGNPGCNSLLINE